LVYWKLYELSHGVDFSYAIPQRLKAIQGFAKISARTVFHNYVRALRFCIVGSLFDANYIGMPQLFKQQAFFLKSLPLGRIAAYRQKLDRERLQV
jgi:hypothetical protein